MIEVLQSQIDRHDLRDRIIGSLVEQGFRLQRGAILPPKELSKERIRKLHETAVKHRIEKSRIGLSRKESELLSHIASGSEIAPTKISPRLVEVQPRSSEELLFRYASLHWSIPVSSGYGRRLRFLVIDDHNDKLIGLIGLGDPIYSLSPRDHWIGWSSAERKSRLANVMEAFVLGAVPPYSFLLCGKLVAMLATSDAVRGAFKRKYGGTRSVIRQKSHDGRLALITTTSALGRSSVYNRLKLDKRLLYQSVGFTKGSGEFHFANGLYEAILKFAEENCEPTAKQKLWGKGFRNRREVIKKCLPALGLSSDWLYHGIEREIFVIPLAKNAREFLRGEHSRVLWYHYSEADIYEYFKQRWMLPRASWDKRFEGWSSEEWSIWSTARKGRQDDGVLDNRWAHDARCPVEATVQAEVAHS